MSTTHLGEGEPFNSEESWERIKDQPLIELAHVAELMASTLPTIGDSRGRAARLAYQELADAATRLRLIRHGCDRLREQYMTDRGENE